MNSTFQVFENGYALFIGIKYGHLPNPLNGTLKDVEALNNHFIDPQKAAFKPDNITLLIEEKATQDGILKALDALATKTINDPEATVIVYYSGHGGKRGDISFIAPYDYHLGNLLDSKAFASKLAALTAKKCIIILDCCHAENIPIEKAGHFSQGFLNSFIDEIDTALGAKPIEKSVGDNIRKGSGRVILTSCQTNETSLDIGSNGLFTQVLLECLNGTNNIESDGWVRLIDLIRYVPSKVSERAKQLCQHNQNPMFKRIENLSSEEFIICAYDISQANGMVNLSHNSTFPHETKNSKNEEISKLINEGDFVGAFAILDTYQHKNAFQYNRLKREFKAGLKGVDLLDFSDRLKVFLADLK